MNHPLQAAYYADQSLLQTVQVVENFRLAKDTYRLRFKSPEIAKRILPGQFLMLRLAHCDDPLIGRPMAMYDTILSSAGEPIGIDVVYLVKGKLTSRLKDLLPGQHLEVWGPLGNGFEPQQAEHLIMVAGGIGQTPFLSLAREALQQRQFGNPLRQSAPTKKITFCYGARSAEYLAGVEDFENLGIEIQLATDDGSSGHHGLVTDLLEQTLAQTNLAQHIVCCGPEPMMQAVAKIAKQRSTTCQVSLETPMACGIGICFTCVAKVLDNSGQWDYKRTCVDGPVFDAEKIVW